MLSLRPGPSDPCPCGNPLPYALCCGQYHDGAEAPTAEALMRSRYSAFVAGDAAYLLRTSHPTLRRSLSPGAFQESFRLHWLGLNILAVRAGTADDVEGAVRFQAHYQGGVIDECSRFRRIDGAWTYVDASGSC